MAVALPYIAVAAMGASALGSIAQGQSQAAADKYNASIASNNAQIASTNAAFAGAEGQQQVNTQEMKTRQQVAGIKTSQAAGGIDVNSGSAAAVQESQDVVGAESALNIRANAVRQAYGYQTQAAQYQAQSALDKSEASNAEKAGYIGAATSLLQMGAGAESSGMFDSWGSAQAASSLNAPLFSSAYSANAGQPLFPGG